VNTHPFFRRKAGPLLFLFFLVLSLWQDTYAQTREGLIFSTEEFAFWRKRAGFDGGPARYKSISDVSTNSPGDWDRIVNYKNQWVSNPGNDRYANYFQGCLACAYPNSNQKVGFETDAGFFILHAAFYARMVGDATLKTAIRNEILAHYVRETYQYTDALGKVSTLRAFDFTNAKRWVPNCFNDISAGFQIADMLWKLTQAFELTSSNGSTAWSDNDKAEFNAWLKAAGYFVKTNYDTEADKLFVNRAAGNYTPAGTAAQLEKTPSNWAVMYTDGSGVQHKARYISKNYSNRRVTQAKAVVMIGTHLNDPVLIESGVKYMMETIMFGFGSTGWYCDYLRQEAAVPASPGHQAKAPNPQKGFTYSHSTLLEIMLCAEVRARVGDFRLYNFKTTGGTTAIISGSERSSDGTTVKGLEMLILAQIKLWQHQAPALYGTEDAALATGVDKAKYLMDGTNEFSGDHAVWYADFAIANQYYKNATITNMYLTGGASPYPANPQSYGPRNGWTGGSTVGLLFLFGQREAAGPVQYPGSGPAATQQSITFPAIADVTYGATSITLTATASSGLPITYRSSDVTKATVSGTTLTFKNAGNVTIYASQGGNGTYAPAQEVSQGVVINKKALTVTAVNATRVYNKANPASFAVTYAGFITGESNSVLTTQPTVTTTATQSSNVGNYPIAASNGAALNYALSYLPGTLSITKGTVTLLVGANLNRLTSDLPFNLNVTAVEQGTTNVVTGLPIGYAKQSGTSVTSVSSVGLVTLSGSTGTSTLLLTVTANTNYFQVTNTLRDVVVTSGALTAQSITFNALTAKTYGDAPSTLSATGGGSGNPVTFSSSDPGIATTTGTNGATLTIVKAGIVNIKANQAGNGSFQDAPEVVRQLTINPKSLSVTADNKTRVYGLANPPFTISYSGFVGSETSANLTSEPIATTAAVPTSQAGNYAIVPSGGSANNYSFAYHNGVLSVTQASQAITFASLSDHPKTDVPFQVNASASSGLAVLYSLVSGPATVSSSGVVTLTGTPGTVTVRASQAGNINYTAASNVDRSFAVVDVVVQQNQTITVVDPGTKVYSPGQTFDISVSSNSGLTVTTSIVSGPGTLAGNTVTITGAGTIVLKSVQAGNSNYFPATDVFTQVVVNKATQVVTSPTIPDKYISDPTFSVVAVASSGLTVTLTANNKLIQNTSTTFTPLALGEAVITAIQAGNGNYLPDTLLLTFNVVSAPVTGTVDILDGRPLYKSGYRVGSGTATYWLYNLLWPSLSGAYTTSRVVVKSGMDASGNVVKNNILDNFELFRWDGSAWVLMLSKRNNMQSIFDTTLAGIVVTDKLYMNSTRDIRNPAILDSVKVYGKPFTGELDNSFNYTLAGSASTSAGVYTASGVLVRTLWSGLNKTVGSYSYAWDGLKDDGSAAAAGDYTTKVTSNNVTYTWEGVIGNSSGPTVTGPSKHRGLDPIRSMAINGTTIYYALGYTEGITGQYKTTTTNPQSRTQVMPSQYAGPPQVEWVATDGTKVYWAGLDPYANTKSFVWASNVSNDASFTLTSGTNYSTVYGGPIVYSTAGLLTNASGNITGLAVQAFGSYLFVSRSGMGYIGVYNKTTGAFVRNITLTTPKSIATQAGFLWVSYGSSTVEKFTVNGDGTLTTTGVTIAGLTDPRALSVSQDAATIGVNDGGTSQQVKAFSTADGSSSWTLGTAGGYSTDASVSNAKFYFNDLRGKKATFLAFAPDGSFWVGDGGNCRVQHYSSSRTFIDRIMFLPRAYYSAIVLNDATRVIAMDGMEFAIDYGQSLTATSGWSLAKNWGYALNTSDYDFLVSLRSPVTLSNGRTYALTAYNNGKDPYQIVEMVSGGVLRFTGVFAGGYPKLYADGSLRRMDYLSGAQQWKKKALTGFSSNNPTYGSETAYQTAPDQDVNNAGAFNNPGEVTTSGIHVAFEGNKTSGYHLAGLSGNAYQWKTSKANATSYTGGFPTDGTYDIGNQITTTGGAGPGDLAIALENNIFWHYYGEFWKGAGGQVNKFNHYSDKGLFIGQFGHARDAAAEFGVEAPAEMAGNAFFPDIVKVGSDYYVYHNDESFHAGIHRWKVSGLNTISTQTATVTITTP
jgi:hypothetical protein